MFVVGDSVVLDDRTFWTRIFRTRIFQPRMIRTRIFRPRMNQPRIFNISEKKRSYICQY